MKRGCGVVSDVERAHAAAARAAYVEALRRERGFYVQRGEMEDAAAVDAVLAELGELEDTAARPPMSRTVPKRRSG